MEESLGMIRQRELDAQPYNKTVQHDHASAWSLE